MDQIAARALGSDTQLASLELALESVELLGACDAGYSCAYANTISWRTPTTPLPMENDPRAVFERLFGDSDSTDPAARLARIAEGPQHPRFGPRTGRRAAAAGSARATGRSSTEYLEAVRDVERRIQKAEEQSARELPVVEQPAGIPTSFEEHARLMFDLLALAFQTDLTRVSTFMLGREVSGRAYPEIGVPDAHHPLSHHQNDPEKLAKLAKINVFHTQLFAYFVEKMRSHARRRRLAARSLDAALRLGDQRQQRAHARQPAARARRRRGRPHQGRPSPRVPEGHAGDEPVPQHARQARRAGREHSATAPGGSST